MTKEDKKNLVGIGLRHAHFPELLQSLENEERLSIGWLEGISENFIDTKGRPFDVLKKVREQYQISLHGVSLSIAGPDEINSSYLKKLKKLYDEIDPILVSDHLCWTGLNENNLHNLLPFPYTDESLRRIAKKVNQVQDAIERQINLENLSAYFSLSSSQMTEWQFLNSLRELTGCGILLDINNVYVNSVNQGFCASEFLESIDTEAVNEIHLAGHTDMGEYLFDTHSKEVCEEVWSLYRKFLKRKQNVMTLIEWDEDIPALKTVESEAIKALEILSE